MSDAAFLESVVVADKHGVPIHSGDHVKVHENRHHQPEGDVSIHISYTVDVRSIEIRA